MVKSATAAKKAAGKSKKKDGNKKQPGPKAAGAKSAAASGSGESAGRRLVQDAARIPNAQDIVNLVRRCDVQSKQASEAAGAVGEMIAKAVETKHFNRKALSIVRSLNAMSDNKLQEAWPHLLIYAEALGFEKRCSNQGKLALQPAEGGESEGEAEGEGGAGGDMPSPSLQSMDSADEPMTTH